MDHTNNLYITICSYIETGFLPFRERKKERKKKSYCRRRYKTFTPITDFIRMCNADKDMLHENQLISTAKCKQTVTF